MKVPTAFRRALRLVTRLAFLLVLCGVVGRSPEVFAAPAESAPAQALSVDVVPGALHLSPARRGEILVTLTNTNGPDARDIRVDLATRDAFELAFVPEGDAGEQPLQTLAQGRQETLRFTLHRISGAGLAPKVFLRVRYRIGEGEAARSAVTIKEVAVTDPSTDAGAPWSARLEGPQDLVLEQRKPQRVYLLLENHLSVPLRPKRVEVCGGDTKFDDESLDPCDSVEASVPALPAEIAPGRSAMVPIRLAARKRIQQGKSLLVFDVVCAHDGVESHVVLKQDVDLGIPGESKLLALVGVPLFVVVPGFLTLMAFLMSYRWIRPKQEPKLQPVSAEFWVIAVFLSVIAERVFTKLRTYSYTDGYGLDDVAWVWLVFTSVGFAAWFVYWLVQLARAYIRETRFPSFDEYMDPSRALACMAARPMTFPLLRVNLKKDDTKRVLFVASRKDAEGRVWVVPTIAAEADDATKLDELLEQLNNGPKPTSAEDASKQLTKLGAKLSWKGNLRPRHVEASTLEENNDRTLLFKTE